MSNSIYYPKNPPQQRIPICIAMAIRVVTQFSFFTSVLPWSAIDTPIDNPIKTRYAICGAPITFPPFNTKNATLLVAVK